MGFVDGCSVPEIGSIVNIANGRQGRVEKVLSIPILSWFNHTLYYVVRYGDGSRPLRLHSFRSLTVVGKGGESIY